MSSWLWSNSQPQKQVFDICFQIATNVAIVIDMNLKSWPYNQFYIYNLLSRENCNNDILDTKPKHSPINYKTVSFTSAL